MEYIPVKNNKELVRDNESGAILNVSDSDFDYYMQRKQQKINELEEMNKLKNDVGELKDMMKLIIQKLESNS